MNKEHFENHIIDADSLFYMIAATTDTEYQAKKNLDTAINRIIDTINAETVTIFIKGPNNFRFLADSDYKGNRKSAIDEAVKERVDQLYAYARELYITSDDGEADDYCAITAYESMKAGQSFIVSHIDKDLNTIPGWHHNFRTNDIYSMSPEVSYFFLMKQLIMGDSTDNIKGIWKVGPKGAEKALIDLPPAQMYNTVLSLWQEKMGANWKELYVKCANCIYLRTSGDDLRPLTFEELEERFTWITDTGLPSQNDQQEPLDSATTSKTDTPEDDTSERNS
jgi:5'-3' exonuclease